MTLPTATQKASLTPDQVDVVSRIVQRFIELGVETEFVPPVSVGPVVSSYRFRPIGKTRVSHIEALSADFAVMIGVEDVLVRRRAGDTAVSISIPNKERKETDFRQSVSATMKSINEAKLRGKPIHIPINLGVDEYGDPFVDDLTELPHLLIAGQTNAGKSTLMHNVLGTIVYTMNSRSVQLILSDTKGGVEFPMYNGLPHLAFPTITTVFQTLEKMQWLSDVTEDRLKIIAHANCRNILQYNERCKQLGGNHLPFMILVIDELADFMLSRHGERSNSSKIATDMLASLVGRSRAAGVYIICGTQRPSVDVVSGRIKANFPARIAFKTASQVDSRTILDECGAEHLIVPGDMLYKSPQRPTIVRLHSPHAKIEDIRGAVAYAKGRELQLQP